MKTLLSVTVLALTISSAMAGDLTFDRYHTQDEINQYMIQEATSHPDLVQRKQLGTSAQGREISYVILAKGTPSQSIYINGTHHGDEWSATESVIGLIDYLIAQKDTPEVSQILSNYAIYIQPLVNPDGHQAHTREDSFGNDPNRDYSYPQRTDANSFKTKEIQLVKSLVDQVHFRAAAAYHSGIEEVLWSWCYTSKSTPDNSLLINLGKTVAEAMGFDRYLQSYNDYATTGEFIDYAYMKDQTMALTFEVSTDKTPDVSELQSDVDRSIKGAMAMMQTVHLADLGQIDLHVVQHAHYGKLGKIDKPRLE
jgi:predicted deacylase